MKQSQILLDLKARNASEKDPGSHEVVFVFLAIALVAAILVLWAVFIRKPKRRRSLQGDVVPNSVLQKRHSQDRRSRKFKRRNPTLAETGGLPPRKPDRGISESL